MRKIAIFGPPRSGTSWLSHIFNSHPKVTLRFQPLFSYGHKDMLSPSSTTEDITTFFESILQSNDPFTLMQTKGQKNYPSFPKSSQSTHLVFKETRYLHIIQNILEFSPDVKIIGIIRNPLSTLASWIQAPKEFLDSWNIQDEWRTAPSKNQGRPEDFFGFNKWVEAAQRFTQFETMYPDNFKLIQYSHLNNQSLKVANDIFEFCELSLDTQTTSFIRDSKSRQDKDPYSVYKMKADDNNWRLVLPSEIIEIVINELSDTPLNRFLQDNIND